RRTLSREGTLMRMPANSITSRVLSFSFLFLFMAVAFASAQTQSAVDTKGSPSTTPPADISKYVGAETCKTCHEEIYNAWEKTPHWKTTLNKAGGPARQGCEGCHGPGADHVAGGGDVTKIFNPAKHSAKEVDAKCLTCHAAAHPNFDRSPHARANVSCISCHSVHQSKEEETLLKAPQPALCFQCHADTKPAFNMPFHQKVNEGLITCSDCHDVHGTFLANNLKSTADQNAICTKCHTETRGPFVYEHVAVKAEGCLGCHTPHGSQNPRLLNMPAIAPLCNQCHSGVAANTVHGMGAGSSETITCTNCHTYIHGSNMNAAFLR
ncbi:MAG: DmsE family decaheme c-type cytochrome, partial [Candidatus Sulfotelmatobacter sp.]